MVTHRCGSRRSFNRWLGCFLLYSTSSRGKRSDERPVSKRHQTWWQQKSRRSKAITILATLLILQIGLCFGTPLGVSWSDNHLGTRLDPDSYGGLGYMFLEAILASVVFLVFAGVLIFYRPSVPEPATLTIAPDENPQAPENNEDHDIGR